MTETCWIDNRHPEWEAWAPRWRQAADFYTGDCVRKDKLRDYLVAKSTAEHDTAYEDRLKIPNYDNDLGTVVDKLRGVLFSAEGRANYLPSEQIRREEMGPDGVKRTIEVWGAGLGDPDDPTTLAGRLEMDADGQGNGRSAVMEQLATELLVSGDAWQMIGMLPLTDAPVPVPTAQGDERPMEMLPVYQVLPALSVVNWQTNGRTGVLEWALILEEYDARTSWMDSPKAACAVRYLLVTRDGWSRWIKNDKGAAEPTGDVGSWVYVNRRGQRVVPIRHVTLPTTRKIGPALADKSKVLLNKQSEMDAVSRNTAFPILSLVGTDTEIREMSQRINDGHKVLQRNPEWTADHGFIAPPTESLQVRMEAIEQEHKAFYTAAFLQYGDAIAGTQKSATQVNAESHSGIGAFLSSAKGTIDAAEQWFLDMIAQAQWKPGTPGERNWWKATIKRADTFAPLDPDAAVTADILKYFGSKDVEPAPLGRSAQIQGAKQIASYMGVSLADAEAEAAVDLINAKRYGDLMTTYGIEVPPEMKGQIAERVARALGFPNAKAIADRVSEMAEDSAATAEAGRAALQGIAPGAEDAADDPEDPEGEGDGADEVDDAEDSGADA